jgi:pentatricopeptide repeat protein
MLTTLLKVYSKGGLFEKAKGLLTELEASGFAQDEVKHVVSQKEVLNVHTCMVP